VKFYFTGTEFLYEYNANLSKVVAAKKLPSLDGRLLQVLWWGGYPGWPWGNPSEYSGIATQCPLVTAVPQ